MIVSFGYGYTGKREMRLLAESEEEDAFILAANRAIETGKCSVRAVEGDGLTAEWCSNVEPPPKV